MTLGVPISLSFSLCYSLSLVPLVLVFVFSRSLCLSASLANSFHGLGGLSLHGLSMTRASKPKTPAKLRKCCCARASTKSPTHGGIESQWLPVSSSVRESPLLVCCVMLNHRRTIPTRAINLASIEAVECQHQLLKQAPSVCGLRCLVCGQIRKHVGLDSFKLGAPNISFRQFINSVYRVPFSTWRFASAAPLVSRVLRTSSTGELVGCRKAAQEQRMCRGGTLKQLLAHDVISAFDALDDCSLLQSESYVPALCRPVANRAEVSCGIVCSSSQSKREGC